MLLATKVLPFLYKRIGLRVLRESRREFTMHLARTIALSRALSRAGQLRATARAQNEKYKNVYEPERLRGNDDDAACRRWNSQSRRV